MLLSHQSYCSLENKLLGEITFMVNLFHKLERRNLNETENLTREFD